VSRPVDAEVETAGLGSTASETSAGDSPALISRRRFVVGSVTFAGAGALLAAGCGSTGSGGSAGDASPTPSAWIPVSISGLAAGEPRWVEFDVAGATTGAAVSPIAPSADATPADALPKTRGGAWLVKGSDGTLVAFAPNCAHQLCLYDWEAAEARFHCRCHPGFFGLDGKVLGGPPPRPLWRYDTRPGSSADTLEIGWHAEG
jgi:Rieske Fe-S protein